MDWKLAVFKRFEYNIHQILLFANLVFLREVA
jgi:hypothetical protein